MRRGGSGVGWTCALPPQGAFFLEGHDPATESSDSDAVPDPFTARVPVEEFQGCAPDVWISAFDDDGVERRDDGDVEGEAEGEAAFGALGERRGVGR